MKIDRIHPAIHRIEVPFGELPSVVFLYLIRGERLALIDTGAAASPAEYIAPALEEIGVPFSQVGLILNTHGHMDHAAGNFEAKQRSGAALHIHPADLPMATSRDVQGEFMASPLRALGLPEAMVQQRATHVVRIAGKPVDADVLLVDGQTLDLGAGVVLRVVHTPGHTPGSVSFFWETEGVLFSGDAVQGLGFRMGAYPLYFDAPSYRTSLSTIQRIEPGMLCMGHAYLGGSLFNDPTRRGPDARALVKESIQVADAIQRAAEGAVRAMPGAGKGEIALAALSELIYQIPTQLARETRMPGLAAPALATHIQAALDGSYPA